MKKTPLFLLVITPLLANTFSSNPFFRPLPFKEAIIEYNLNGNEKGFETLYIKEYGKYRVLYRRNKTNFLKKGKKNEEYTIITPKWIYKLDPHKNAKRVPNLKYLLYIRFKELNKKEQENVLKNIKKINYLPIKSIRFKIAKNYAVINEIPCDLLIQKGTKECYGYEGSLLLKSQVKFLGFNTTKILYNTFETKTDPKLFDTSDLNITDEKLQSVQLYELSKKIINLLKKRLNEKNIFINKKEKKQDLQQVIQEGIKTLNEL